MIAADVFTIDVGDNVIQALNLIANIITILFVTNRTKELKPNHGSSLYDKVDKLYRTTAATDRASDQPNERKQEDGQPVSK